MDLCFVLRKITVEVYIERYLFYIYIGYLLNRTFAIVRIFLYQTIFTYKSYFWYSERIGDENVSLY